MSNPYSLTNFKSFFKGKIVEESSYKNDLLNGQYKLYWNNGVVMVDMSFVNGLADSTYFAFDTKGRPWKIIEYKDGVFNGKCVLYYKGIKLYDAHFSHGTLDGNFCEYYPNGLVYRSLIFRDGRMLLRLALLALFLLADISCNRSQDLKSDNVIVDEIKLSEIVSFARSHFAVYDSATATTALYDNYDFKSLKPSTQKSATVQSVKAFYDKDNNLVKLLTKSTFNDSDFEFHFVRNIAANYTIFFAEQIYDTQFENDQDDVVNGFFLVYNNRCYFLGFEAPFCVMELDAHLKVSKTLKFGLDRKLLYKTTIKYKNDIHLYSDLLYTPKESFMLSKETLISDVLNKFDASDFTFYTEYRIGWVKEDDHLPFWIFGGAHEYDYAVKR
jgi:hypothetical protein